MRGYSRDTLIFILTAAALMWVADYTLFGGKEAYHALTAPPAPAVVAPSVPAAPAPIIIAPEGDDFDFFNDDEPDWAWADEDEDFIDEDDWIEPIVPVAPQAPAAPAPVPQAIVAPPPGGPPKIAIIIDDVGMTLKHSQEAVDLPAPITIAILPYAEQADHFAREAREKGHDILIHMPMEAMHAPVSLGGMGLTTDMDEAAIDAMMDKATHRFEGYIGINNHMGSKFTADHAAMERLMPYLKKHDLAFVDSRTIGSSVAAEVAAEQGVPNATRDVFLDHEETPQFVAQALAHLEKLARRNGSAIAIGHPKDVTLEGLRAWLPTVEQKGFILVPVHALLRHAPVTSAPDMKEKLLTDVAPVDPAPPTMPAAPPSAPPLLYLPSPAIHSAE